MLFLSAHSTNWGLHPASPPESPTGTVSTHHSLTQKVWKKVWKILKKKIWGKVLKQEVENTSTNDINIKNKRIPSNLSSNPPCPGIILLQSLTPHTLFNLDSIKSPI